VMVGSLWEKYHRLSQLPLVLLSITILGLTISIVNAQASATGARPNILLILADDLGYADMDWKDDRLLTPNLHSLAHSSHSTYLHNSYVNQLCTP